MQSVKHRVLVCSCCCLVGAHDDVIVSGQVLLSCLLCTIRLCVATKITRHVCIIPAVPVTTSSIQRASSLPCCWLLSGSCAHQESRMAVHGVGACATRAPLPNADSGPDFNLLHRYT